jgi:putative endonuclease
MSQNTYYVYIIGGKSETLYTGITNNLERRMLEHKRKLKKGYSSKFGLNKLLYFDTFAHALDAIEAEKKVKGWTRAKKLALIRTINPTFEDLSKDWPD